MKSFFIIIVFLQLAVMPSAAQTLSKSTPQKEVSHGVTLPETDELHIGQTEKYVPGSAADRYMRISLDYTVKAGSWTLFSLPSMLDGYYFGPKAERYAVTNYDSGASPVTLEYAPMNDSDDFEAGHLYLVKSTIDVDEIVCMTPGISTEVSHQNDVMLMCMTLDDFNPETGMISMKSSNSLTNEKMFDLAGHVVKHARHGIFIVNGRKVYAK